MSWPIRVTSRPVYAFFNGPNEMGALSGEMIVMPVETNVRVVEEVKMNPRFGVRWLAKTTGKLPSVEKPEVMAQWWSYIGKDDLKIEPKIVSQAAPLLLTKEDSVLDET